MTYIQYGCGYSAPAGWLNFDSSPTIKLEKVPLLGRFVRKNATRFPENVVVGDIVAGLPVPDNSADGVYASHVLEHLARDEFNIALRNTFRILKPGGLFRLIVPDLEERARRYLQLLDGSSSSANDWFMRATYLGLEERPSTLVQKVSRAFGGSLHHWMWDYASMHSQLEQSGFANIRRCSFGDSDDSMFKLVEESKRFYDPVHQIRELAVEAQKPSD